MENHETLCSHCKQAILSRRRLPSCLRPLRLLGIRVRSYRCPACQKRSIRWY